MEIIRIGFSLAVSMLWLALTLLGSRSPKRRYEDRAEKEPQQTEAEPEDPAATMLRSATKQSMNLNLSAMDSFQRMSEVAGQYREDTVTKHHPQNDPWYQHTEWMENEENWS